MICVALIFGPPLVVASTMLCPQGFAYTVNAVVGYAGILLLLLPIAAWPLFVIQAIAPPPGQSRLRAVISTWLGGSALVSLVMNLLASMLEYSPTPLHFYPTGHELIAYNPRAGFLLGSFTLSMLAACGVWGLLARIASAKFVLRGAIATGLLLFGVVAGLGYILSPQQLPTTVGDPANPRSVEHVKPGMFR